ncbi:extracellular solute-binding protein family 1 [Beutenbergia cavernae DSM 12333]|uniref:Extracellular solute-binding protein family 1 n=1 Tax=Beutenbergia cavernae (strain ATCC BAA-8 / DSM 12333 / CCUG 43141 / JCM 11478 / NBRC 16432 / NCIMB 13614 / HKI 0122) TaxID=471853 RepID=C5BYU6_BEUC1|nr:ABC transporter substrate-binding protein [Beutenbergia cavernae]ACQ79054.1 extracellular solute-binding protein family 1 [Beutenbergia cavernae DSM 12333]
MATPHLAPGLTRRGFHHLALGAGAVTAIGATAACAVEPEETPQETGSGPVELNFVWWGDAARAEVTEAALDIYREAHPDVTITTEYQDSTPYKDKLATRIAAGDAPDLMAMRRDQLREYGDRGALLDLNGVDGLDIGQIPDSAIDPWTVDGALLGVPAGLNTIGFIVQTTVLDEYGIDLPDGDTWTWDDLKVFADSITAASGGAVYGTGFEVATVANLYVYVRQQGEDLYTEDGALGASVATMQGWFDMIGAMRESGGFPPAGFFEDVGGGAEASYTAQGKLASEIIPTNNFKAYNEACGGTLALLRIPSESTAERRGQSIDCPHLWSIAADSPNQAAAADLLNFLTNDLSAWQAMMTTRGVPPNSEVAQELMGDLPEDDVTASEYLLGLAEEDLPPAFADPVGATEVQSLLADISTEVEFERVTAADGAQQFVDEANAVLG